MLKFQDDYTTLIATFEDFILLVYTIIDDLYQPFVPASVSQRRNVITQKYPIRKSLPWASVASLLVWIPKMLGIPL